MRNTLFLVGILACIATYRATHADETATKAPAPTKAPSSSAPASPSTTASPTKPAADVDRSPVDVALSPDESWLVTANQTSNSVSLVRAADGQLLDEVTVGRRPGAIVLSPDGTTAFVTASYSGELTMLRIADGRLKPEATIMLGFEPHGVALAPDGKTAYVALSAADQVAVVDVASRAVTATIAVGRWPRYLALTPDGSRLAVGTSGDRGITIVDTAARKVAYQEQFLAINVAHLQMARDGKSVYFPWVAYRFNAISPAMIRMGWVLGTRIGRVKTDGPARREAMSLDVPGLAVADPFGIGITPDDQWIVASASGTHELLVYRMNDLPIKDYANLDHIDPGLRGDKNRFYRIPLGGRPMGLRMSRDSRTVFVANYLDNSVQVVDIADRQLVRSIELGGPAEPSLVRRGEAIFYDGQRSLDQWYSCHTCHYEGGSNAERMDTMNDGTPNTPKTVLPLFNLHETSPWTWHGWQKDLRDAMHASLTTTMQGSTPSDADVDALLAYFRQLEPPPNPYRKPDGSISAAAERGKKVFEGAKANCASCHSGPLFTDGQVHDVGLGNAADRYQGFNTPSLRGVFRKVRLLHDGRSKSLEQALTGPHSPAKVTGAGELTAEELADLIEYLKTL